MPAPSAGPPAPAPSSPQHARRVVLLLAALALLAALQRPDGHLHLIFPALDGDAVLIQTPTGGFVLIDGGADPDALAAVLGRRLPFWRRELDALVLTEADPARLPGQVAALARYRPRLALAPADMRRSATLDAWRRLLAEHQTPLHELRAGQRLDLGGARLVVLAVRGGTVLRVEHGATAAVLAPQGWSRPAALRPAALLAYPWEIDAHVPLVQAVRPAAIVLSDGAKARQPIRQTYRERAIGGAQLYHERIDGAVEWVSDGTRSWMRTGE